MAANRISLRCSYAGVDYSDNFKVRIVSLTTHGAIQYPRQFRELLKYVGDDFNIADNAIIKLHCHDSNYKSFYLNTDEIGRLLMKDIRNPDNETLIERVFNQLLNSNDELLFLPGTLVKIQFWMVTEKGEWFCPPEYQGNYEPETFNPRKRKNYATHSNQEK